MEHGGETERHSSRGRGTLLVPISCPARRVKGSFLQRSTQQTAPDLVSSLSPSPHMLCSPWILPVLFLGLGRILALGFCTAPSPASVLPGHSGHPSLRGATTLGTLSGRPARASHALELPGYCLTH